ncbi:allantoicase, expressed, purine use [Aspergillus indologenus CBS 114.80]|uniref:allantoicase n=1 Tax=Aspergillus indologenus CBS 114.80 TaxID=1450541 RepID=A0A2V5HXS5_9EURO|nr:allantoicase, expressed, purine use [Aspergillus indologenus CBS 114.80]
MATTTTEYPYISGAEIDRTFAHTTNLASAALNTRILACSNEYFAAASNLLTPTAPINRPGVFIHTGAWYDGWETRRHNPAPYDWVVIKLGPARAAIQGVEVDTGFFVGNYGERAAVQATCADADDATVADPNYAGWATILPPQPCGPAQRRAWPVPGYDPHRPTPYTHVRLLMYPDGGFGRLRLYGHAIPAAAHAEDAQAEEELSSALCGGLALAASDQHYTPCANLLLPGRGKDMGDGWETARSRAPGHVDWAIVQLGLPGSVSRVVVDTKDFRGNFPRAVRVHGLVQGEVGDAGPAHDHPGWVEIVQGDQRCQADTEHVFQGADLAPGVDAQAFSHVKLTLVPDGGVKRFRVFGRRA